MTDLKTLTKIEEAYNLLLKAEKMLASIQVDYLNELDDQAEEAKKEFMKEQEGLAQDFS